MKKSKKIILTLCTAFIAVLSLCFSFFNTNNTLQVKANSTYISSTFNSSNLFLVRLGFTSSSSNFTFSNLDNDQLDNALYFNFSFKIDYDSNSDNLTFYVKGLYSSSYYLYDLTGSNVDNTFANIGSYNFSTNSLNKRSTRVRSGGSTYYSPILFNVEYFDSSSNSYIVANNSLSVRPSLVIHKIIFGNYTNYSSMGFANNSLFGSFLINGHYNFISLVDSLGFRFTYFIPVTPKTADSFENRSSNYLTYREYYTSSAFNFSDSQAYQQGYNQGLLDNQTNIYDNGYNAGNTAGYSNGYNAGLNASNQYSFFNLFGAVLDAPIATLTGLLNFNILGVNLLTLFLGLLTLAVILLVLRLIRGGK